MEALPEPHSMSIEERLEAWKSEHCDWRQGDCVLAPLDFFWKFQSTKPLTEHSAAVAAEGYEVASCEFPGAVVLTQTCDIVRSWSDRAFVQVAPLVVVDPKDLHQIRKGQKPQYLYIPQLADRCLVGDLDLHMTVEKSVVASWNRLPGCITDQEERSLARAIVRRLERFPFPDDIVGMFKQWEDRIKRKHGKNSPEGQLLDFLDEIRVEARPSWDADPVELEILLILPEELPEVETEVLKQLPSWEALIEPPARVENFEFSVERLSTLKALRYLASAPMNFDHLSAGG